MESSYVLNDIKDQGLCLRLLELIKQHPVLWTFSSKKNLNANRKVNAWRDIARQIGKSEEMVRKKWQSLCAYYRKEKAKVKKSLITGSACTDVYNSNWFAFDSMHFLQDITKPRSTQSTQNMPRSQCGVDLNVDSSPEKEYFVTANKTKAEPSTSQARHEETPVSHQREYANSNVEEHFHDVLISIAKSLEVIISSADSRNATVGTFVTQTLDKLPKAKQEKLIFQIHELIYNIRTESD